MKRAGSGNAFRVAASLGGTFAHVVTFDARSGAMRYGNTLTMPDAMVDDILTGAHKAGAALTETGFLLHGSIIAMNTILERPGVCTAPRTSPALATF